MAGLSKEEREKRAMEKEIKLRSEIEEQLRKEYEEKLNSETSDTSISMNKTRTKKKIPLDTMIPVRSGVQGELIYLSKKTVGYQVEWDQYNAVEYVELGELLSMRNTSRSFYKNNWVFFEDTDEYTAVEIYDFLDVAQYYENAIVGDDLDKIFVMPLDEIKAVVKPLSRGVKDTLALKARKMIDSGEFDSINKIKLLEKLLDVELKPVL
ncbi:hypothetical protein [Clostridium sp. 3-3]|uniref:hypothetical protein n=1 Tax=Clostridium sp. 3-3 TaxID=2070757 RepID=UPI000CDA6E7D|nr:hypothetical protein [Clostridium sp. 3-3]POO87876.1 hypothetical protein C1H59_03675 [Clostridium sp. 3-3]